MAVGSQRRSCPTSKQRRDGLHGEVDKPANNKKPSRSRELPSGPKMLLKHERSWAVFDFLAVERVSDTARRVSNGDASSQSGGHRIHRGGTKNESAGNDDPGTRAERRPAAAPRRDQSVLPPFLRCFSTASSSSFDCLCCFRKAVSVFCRSAMCLSKPGVWTIPDNSVACAM